MYSKAPREQFLVSGLSKKKWVSMKAYYKYLNCKNVSNEIFPILTLYMCLMSSIVLAAPNLEGRILNKDDYIVEDITFRSFTELIFESKKIAIKKAKNAGNQVLFYSLRGAISNGKIDRNNVILNDDFINQSIYSAKNLDQHCFVSKYFDIYDNYTIIGINNFVNRSKENKYCLYYTVLYFLYGNKSEIRDGLDDKSLEELLESFEK